MTLAQQHAGQPPLLFEGNTFRGERDALDEAEPGENARYMQRFEALVHRQGIGHSSRIRQKPGVADGKRDFEKSRILTKPIGTGAAVGEIGTKFATEIGTGNHAHIDFVAKLRKDLRRRAADAISPSLIDAWAYPDIFLNTSC